MSRAYKQFAENVITPGPERKCSICQQLLSNSEAGVRSHLRVHVKNGELAAGALVVTTQMILRRGPVEHRK